MNIIAIVLASILLGACSTIQYKPQYSSSSPEQQASWQHHQAQLNTQKDDWLFVGRFGASTKEDAWSGSIWWKQQQENYSIELTGPLSQGTIRLLGNEEFSELQLAEDNRFSDGDAESLLYRYTGITLPFSGLRYWVLGLPQPKGKKQQITLDNDGRIAAIRQTDWDIHFKRYRQIGNLQMPRKIVLENEDIKVRLVFDQWKFKG